MTHGIIFTLLFILLFFESTILKKSYLNYIIKSKLDLWMFFLFIYFFWQLIYAILLGSNLGDFFQLYWQWIIGVMLYFVISKHASNKIIKTLETIIILTSIIVSSLFIIEVIKVNLLGGKSFFWSIAYLEKGLIAQYYVSTEGGASIENWGTFKRLGGILGTYPYTQLYISLGLFFSLNKIIFTQNNRKFLIPFTISLLGFIVSFYLTGFISFILILMFCFIIFPAKYRKRTLKYLIPLVCIIIYTILTNEQIKYIFEYAYFGRLIAALFDTPSMSNIMVDPPGNITRNIILIWDFIKENPLFLFMGTGFGYFKSAEMSIVSGDLGWVVFFSKVGIVGIFLIVMILKKLIFKTYKVIRISGIDPYYKYLMISSLCYIIHAILSTYHSGALFHSANYCIFFLLIGFISFIDKEIKNIQYQRSKGLVV